MRFPIGITMVINSISRDIYIYLMYIYIYIYSVDETQLWLYIHSLKVHFQVSLTTPKCSSGCSTLEMS